MDENTTPKFASPVLTELGYATRYEPDDPATPVAILTYLRDQGAPNPTKDPEHYRATVEYLMGDIAEHVATEGGDHTIRDVAVALSAFDAGWDAARCAVAV